MFTLSIEETAEFSAFAELSAKDLSSAHRLNQQSA
jgi:hypothetical protein